MNATTFVTSQAACSKQLTLCNMHR